MPVLISSDSLVCPLTPLFSCFLSFLSPTLCSSARWCGCVEWRSLGLVRQTSPSPRAVREVALITRPPTRLSMMTLLLPLPAGQALPKAQHVHTHSHILHVHYNTHPWARFQQLHSLHQPPTGEDCLSFPSSICTLWHISCSLSLLWLVPSPHLWLTCKQNLSPKKTYCLSMRVCLWFDLRWLKAKKSDWKLNIKS